MVIIRSSYDITSIDSAILDHLSEGVAIHVLKMSHRQCSSANYDIFYDFTNNNEHTRKCIFVDDKMVGEMKIVESVYFSESRLTMFPCPADPLDKFNWTCPFCNRQFNDM